MQLQQERLAQLDGAGSLADAGPRENFPEGTVCIFEGSFEHTAPVIRGVAIGQNAGLKTLLKHGRTRPLLSLSNRRSISCMTPALKDKPSAGALRAASHIEPDPSRRESTAELIDRETGLRELMEIFETIIAEAGDLIESRSPELVAKARAALRHFSDEAPRQAE
jgi:hypothetical protein